AEAVSHTVSVYLRSQRATYRDLIYTQLLLGTECARLAAGNPDQEARLALRDFSRERVRDRPQLSAADFVQHTVDFQRSVARLAGSPALHLFVDVLMDLSQGSEMIQLIYTDPERQLQTLSRHESIAEAIASGHPRLAAQRMRAHLETTLDQVDQTTRSERLSPLHSS